MSSLTEPRFDVLPPRRESPRPSVVERMRDGGSTPRCSIDHPRQSSEASSSRRPSIHQSPTSIASSSHRQHEDQYLNEERNGWHGEGSGRLPRITTSNVDRRDGENGDDDGPRSAPVNSPRLYDGTNGSNGPIRSSSSPDPMISRNPRNPQSNSPVERGTSAAEGPPILGSPYSPSGQRRPSPSDIPPHPIPPRMSFHFDPQDRVGNSQTSRSSLSESGSGTDTPTQFADAPGALSPSSTPRSGRRGEPTYCGQCGQLVHGQFVRAMRKVYHLNCFRCKDCNKVVAQKFFPVEDVEGMYPLCERDYFARLDLICNQCDQALRSSYITACGNKYHVEHFTCTVCDVLFGPNDLYYEHGHKVYCHYHYSTSYAVKCVGCETAILKQFVEMNRNGRDECWHPECYMISKFWNVRLASKNFGTPASSAVSSAVSLLDMTPASSLFAVSSDSSSANSAAPSPSKEPDLTPEELKARQDAMETKVQQIWYVLSGYEESSAALIGDMLRAVNGRQLLEIILLAERFILHVETLFAVIDDLEAQFALAGAKGMSHAREAKQLCRKLVNLFSTMSQIAPNPAGPTDTQDMFNLITQLAHYLKILIRIALTGSIKLERDQNNPTAMTNCLARLNLLAMDNSDPTVKKRGDFPDAQSTPRPAITLNDREQALTPSVTDEEQLKRSIDALTRLPKGFIPSTQRIAYGYRSLAPEVTGETTLRGPQGEEYIPPESCARCKTAIEEDCIRLGMFIRWHSGCVACSVCGEKAPISIKNGSDDYGPSAEGNLVPSRSSRRPPPQVDEFFFEAPHAAEPPNTILCGLHRSSTCKHGFECVSRLEQYAFLLHIALRRLYVHFRMHHDLPSVRDRPAEEFSANRRDSEVKRMKSVTLDRKLSSTARLPQRSTVVESPAGRIANEHGHVVSARNPAVVPTVQIPNDLDTDDEVNDPPPSASVDVLRPPFARNNTSVLIITENGPEVPDDAANSFTAPTASHEDDAITLGDIPLLADQTIRDRSFGDERPLLSSLNQLQSLILKHFALLQLQKTGIGHLIELDEVLELLEVRKSQWWNKIFKGNNKKDQKKKGVFGVPIEILVERTGSDSSQGASNANLRVPEFIEEMLLTMRQMDMAVEGIFRKNGNIRRLQQISEALDKDSTTVNLSEENPVQLAALLKRFLREMPDPLLTFRLHKLFCAAASLQNREERQRCLHLLVILLPRYNRDTMEVLFVFLKWVASFSYRDEETGSRMDMANLATVICPSILYAKGANAARDESFIAIQAVQELLENQDEYYTVPNELVFVLSENIFNIFAKELDLPPKEIHRHCSKYMQARSQAPRVPGSASVGQVRDRLSDSRLSVHRSEGNLSANGDPIRSPPSGMNHSRPTSWIQNHPGSQQSIQYSLGSPSSTYGRSGPFQGSASGSRNSSRGSAPSSPGPDGERRSMQMDRERSWTPVQADQHR